MEVLTISEVARRAGIRPSAIRYYESVEVLPAPRRVNGQRRYDADVLRRLEVIQIAQRAGFTVAEMRTLFNSPQLATPLSARWQVLARQKLGEVDELIARAHAMKDLLEQGLRCGCLEIDECIDCLLTNWYNSVS